MKMNVFVSVCEIFCERAYLLIKTKFGWTPESVTGGEVYLLNSQKIDLVHCVKKNNWVRS